VLFHEEGHSPLFLNASRVKLISRLKAPVKVTTSCVHDHNSLIPFSSVVVTESHEQLIPFLGNLPSLIGHGGDLPITGGGLNQSLR
jgi:hypothetical protein